MELQLNVEHKPSFSKINDYSDDWQYMIGCRKVS